VVDNREDGSIVLATEIKTADVLVNTPCVNVPVVVRMRVMN
jgi:hypothetical protein